jgi:hypothetical protein
MSLPALLGAAAVILGLIGFGRAVLEFGAPGVIAYAKLVLAPAILALFILLSPGRYAGEFPRSLLPSGQEWKLILTGVAVLTGIAFTLSALFGIAWLVTK